MLRAWDQWNLRLIDYEAKLRVWKISHTWAKPIFADRKGGKNQVQQRRSDRVLRLRLDQTLHPAAVSRGIRATEEDERYVLGLPLLIWINLVFYLISTVLEIFSCRPREKAWNPLMTSGSCINVLILNVTASSINAASDLVLLILPQLTI